jgi:tellurite resistance protein TehA-like permease
VNPQYVALALLVFALVATRLWEERQWRNGRFSDRTSALLVVARLPVLGGGFALLTGQTVPAIIAMALIGLVLAAVLYPFVVRRLRRLSER